MKRMIVTVDAELSNFPGEQGLFGRVNGEDWGLGRMLNSFATFGLRGTFFLDVYGRREVHVAAQRRAAEMIFAAGQDLQLQTHPGPAFDPARPRLRDYPLERQVEIIEFGCSRLREWTGLRPRLHRAGDWGADRTTLRALRQCGMVADFSASPWSPNCGYDPALLQHNGWTRIEGLLCGVGTCYRDRLTGRTRRLDLDGVSLAEMADIANRGIEPLFLTLRSFSLMRFNRERTRFVSAGRHIDRLAWLMEHAQALGYEACSASDAVRALHETDSDALPRAALPTSGAMPSLLGIMKSMRGKLATYSA
jgi:hypothetical protein